MTWYCRKQAEKCNCIIIRYDALTPTLAWLSISKRPPDESYRGVTVSVGGLGTAWEVNKYEL